MTKFFKAFALVWLAGSGFAASPTPIPAKLAGHLYVNGVSFVALLAPATNAKPSTAFRIDRSTGMWINAMFVEHPARLPMPPKAFYSGWRYDCRGAKTCFALVLATGVGKEIVRVSPTGEVWIAPNLSPGKARYAVAWLAQVAAEYATKYAACAEAVRLLDGGTPFAGAGLPKKYEGACGR